MEDQVDTTTVNHNRNMVTKKKKMINSTLDIIGKFLMSGNKKADTQMPVERSKNQTRKCAFKKVYEEYIQEGN